MEQKRIAVINYKKCQPEKCNWLCIRVCPVNRTGKECIVEQNKKPIIEENLCTACGICVHKCPFNAIRIVNLSAKLGKPLHQYCKNCFRLYGFALPMQGKVIGLLGANGIGKTTLIKILSAQIVPNLGNFKDNVTDYSNVLEFFRGKEAFDFFNELANREKKFSLKIQRIESIAANFPNLTVGELLERFAAKERFADIAKEFELENIISRKLKEISGGELQRVAIAVALAKDAELYFFDEPCSYLDVSQRLKIGKRIRDKATKEGKAVMLAEHDLIVLDYASDFVHLLFGEPHVYGVVAGKATTRRGINEFLEGYLSKENIRFRATEIKFHERAAATKRKREPLLNYPKMEKKLDGFELVVEEGELYKGEVVSVLGPNGIGKTTFVRMLANEIKPDNVELKCSYKVAYKPQYLKSEHKTVRQLFDSLEIDLSLFESEIEHRLQIKKLFDSFADELSGGELQRVAIALNLAREAEIILLDEPSAFLDVEERLAAAETIKAVVEKTQRSCIVVDHDLLFQDIVGERIIVFEGIPAKKGFAHKPETMESGMNRFLKGLNITFRRDKETKRPRANKLGSKKDREQKAKGQYYYSL